MILSDIKIWEKIKESDTESFKSLYSRYHNQLCLYSNCLVNDVEVAEEIVDDAFLKIWTKRDQINIHSGIKPYLYRCVYNACIEYLSKHRTLNQSMDNEINQQINELVGSSEEYIFNLLQGEEVEKDVMHAIEQLPERCKMIFCMSRFESLTYAEIADRLNISVNTVKTQISRALDSLRKQLRNYL